MYPQFEGSTSGLQSDNTYSDATLVLEELFLSTATQNSLGHALTTTTFTIFYPIVQLLEESPVDKSRDVLNSNFDPLLVGIDLGEIVNLAACGALPSEIDPEIATSIFTASLEQSHN